MGSEFGHRCPWQDAAGRRCLLDTDHPKRAHDVDGYWLDRVAEGICPLHALSTEVCRALHTT